MKLYKVLFGLAVLTRVVFAADTQDSSSLAKLLGVSFPSGTGSTLIIERDGKRYQVDLATKTLQEVGSGGEETPAALFQRNCSGCHGVEGKGIAGIGTPDFTNPAFARSLSAPAALNAIHNGAGGGRMPSFSGKFTEPQIDSLASYVRSFSNTPGNHRKLTGRHVRFINPPTTCSSACLPAARSTAMESMSTSRIASRTIPQSRDRAAEASYSAWTTSR